MKRPDRIPSDVWEKLTVAQAAEAGLLGTFPDELIRNKQELLRDCCDWTMVARLLAENINQVAIGHACRIVRMRDLVKYNGPRPTRIPEDIWDHMTVREALLYGFLDQHDDYKGLNQHRWR
jgi:hypothetical protein